MYLDLINQCFPKGHPLYKHFNRNTLKLSYSTTKNLKAHIDSHNRKLLNPEVQEKAGCNCQKSRKADCPLQGECLAKDIIYQADVIIVKSNRGTKKIFKKTYYGQTKRKFKDRYNEHKTAINNQHSKKETTLSKYVWKLKSQGLVLNKDFHIKWSIKSRAPHYKTGSRKCLLCLKEKTAIAMHDPRELLNSRSELLGKVHP